MNTLSRNESEVTLEIDGSLDALAVEILRPRFDELVESNSNVIIDFTNTNFIDSSGIGSIVFLYKRLREDGHSISLVGVHNQPLELLQFLRIDQAIDINK